MTRRAKRTVSTIAAAVLSGAYWLMYFFFAEAFTAADYRADYQPSAAILQAQAVLALIGGPLMFAGLILLCRRLEARWLGERRS